MLFICRTKWKRQTEESLSLIAENTNTSAVQQLLDLHANSAPYKPNSSPYLPQTISSAVLLLHSAHGNHNNVLDKALKNGENFPGLF